MGKLTLKRIVKSNYSLKMYYSLLWHFPFSFSFCLHPSARPFFLLQFYHRLSPHTLSYCSIIKFFFSWTDSGLTPLKSTKFSNMPMLCKHCHARLVRPISCCSATQPSGWIVTMKTNCLFFWTYQPYETTAKGTYECLLRVHHQPLVWWVRKLLNTHFPRIWLQGNGYCFITHLGEP